MLCPNCGTVVEDTTEKCKYCGYKFQLDEIKISTTPYKEENHSQSAKTLKTFLFISGLIISMSIVLVIFVKYQANKNLEKKYENLSNTYGLSFQEIEDIISSYYYRTWYHSSGMSVKISKNKLIDPTGIEKTEDYKITKLYRAKETDMFTIYITIMEETTIKIQPYTIKDENNIKLYDSIVFSDPNDPDTEFIHLYDKPVQDIFQ